MSISLCIQLHFYIIHLSALLIRLYIFVIFCRNFVWLLCAVSARQPAKGNTLRSFWKVASAYCVAVSRANVISSFCLFEWRREGSIKNNRSFANFIHTLSVLRALCVYIFLQFFLLPFIRFMFCYTFLCLFICNCLTVAQQQTRYYFVVPKTSNSQP